MKRESLSVGKICVLEIAEIPGDLRITGWDRDEIQAKTSGKVLELLTEDEKITLNCDDDLIISLPQSAQIEIGSVAGDASFRTLTNSLKLSEIGGDLTLRKIGDVEVGQIGSDLVLRHATSLKVDSVGDDASIRDVAGDIILSNVGSDLHLREVQGNLDATIGDDAVIYLHPQEGANYNLTAGDDILLRLPINADVEMTLSAGDDLYINLPDIEKTDEKTRTLQLGLATAKLTFSAGSDLRVTSKADAWSDLADFDINTPFRDVDFDILGDEFAENITRHFDDFPDKFFEKLSTKMDTFPDELMDKITGKMDAATRKVDEKMRRAEHKMRRAEHKARRAERHAERKVARHKIKFSGGRTSAASMPVSDDERLLILKMLQEKKISADDAEKLLAALEA